MSRPPRAVRLDALELEGRLLLAALPVPIAAAPTPVTSTGPLVLRILASDASIPPTITTVQGTPQGIVLTFSKPMDPAGASNVNNYAVRSSQSKDDGFSATGPGVIGWLLFGGHTSHSSQSVPLRAAVYDPATYSVTLIPRRRLTYLAQITVTQGSESKTSSRPGHPPDAPLDLTDVEGNPINGDSTPGRFGVGVESGNPRPVSGAATVLVRPSRSQQKLNRQLLRLGKGAVEDGNLASPTAQTTSPTVSVPTHTSIST